MPCESCAIQFSVFRRKKACIECDRYYCSGCLRRGGGTMCAACRVLSTRPLLRHSLIHLKVRDLQSFLHRQNVSTRACVEKEDLISLVVGHVNSASYRRRIPRPTPGPFCSLKGFTNNINELLNQAFDIRPMGPNNTQNSSGCQNTTHNHAGAGVARPVPQTSPSAPCTAPQMARTPNIITTPPDNDTSQSDSMSSGDRRDTADCFEIEDLEDSGWEMVSPPANPLPNGWTDWKPVGRPSNPQLNKLGPQLQFVSDSTVLLTGSLSPPPPEPEDVEESPSSLPLPPVSPPRAASVLDLPATSSGRSSPETSSLQDEPCVIRDQPAPHERVHLSQVKDEAALNLLTVRQLKQLLAANRVDFRGCVERQELLQRAVMLFREHNKYNVDELPIEDCCKICMAAPLECVLLECGHMAACTACAARLPECPICRRYVVRAVRVFRS